MIAFFRKIRQRLFSQNKFANYLFYAVGEILLVVVGILIALQINNWSEHRKQLKIENEIISSLKEELKTNINLIESSIN